MKSRVIAMAASLLLALATLVAGPLAYAAEERTITTGAAPDGSTATKKNRHASQKSRQVNKGRQENQEESRQKTRAA